jgi:hypothetical protein
MAAPSPNEAAGKSRAAGAERRRDVTSGAASVPSVGVPGVAAQHSPERSVYVEYEEAAANASAGGANEIRTFVSLAIHHSVVFNAGDSVATRITKAELAYRESRHRPLQVEDVASALNSAVAVASGPAALQTTVPQVMLLRTVLNERVPHLARMSVRLDATSPVAMSPAEGSFLLLFLATQKSLNGDYQVSPEEWIRNTNRRRAYSRAGFSLRPLPVVPMKTTMAQDLYMYGASQPRSHRSVTTYLVHAALDKLGVSR